jgi:hypothetical protein
LLRQIAGDLLGDGATLVAEERLHHARLDRGQEALDERARRRRITPQRRVEPSFLFPAQGLPAVV